MAWTSNDDIEHRFNYHPPRDEDTKVAHSSVRDMFRETAIYLNFVPEGREKSLMFTKLEEAMFWANAAIARVNAKD